MPHAHLGAPPAIWLEFAHAHPPVWPSSQPAKVEVDEVGWIPRTSEHFVLGKHFCWTPWSLNASSLSQDGLLSWKAASAGASDRQSQVGQQEIRHGDELNHDEQLGICNPPFLFGEEHPLAPHELFGIRIFRGRTARPSSAFSRPSSAKVLRSSAAWRREKDVE